MVLPSSTTKGAHLEATQKHITVDFFDDKKESRKIYDLSGILSVRYLMPCFTNSWPDAWEPSQRAALATGQQPWLMLCFTVSWPDA